MKLMNLAWLGAAAFIAAGAMVAVGTTDAQAWHNGYGHGGGGYNNYHSKHESYGQQQHGYGGDDYHSRKRSEYKKRKYYHRKYGSWDSHPQCLHLGPFGVCEY
jgi:hypothetical protein